MPPRASRPRTSPRSCLSSNADEERRCQTVRGRVVESATRRSTSATNWIAFQTVDCRYGADFGSLRTKFSHQVRARVREFDRGYDSGVCGCVISTTGGVRLDFLVMEAAARSVPASCSTRVWRTPVVRSRASFRFSSRPGRHARRPCRDARTRVSLVTVAAAKDGGLIVRDVEYTPVGSGVTVLERVNLRLPPTGLNLIVGRSGNGKSTLLNLVAGLAEPTGGVITFSDLDPNVHLSSAQRLARVGLVFQFPERHFLGKNMLQELTFGWPQTHESFNERRRLALRLQDALSAVGMGDFPLDTPVRSLSGGYKRRLALAIQLVRDPYVLCLDEPLAGLDWMARAEVTSLLCALRKERAVIVISHDVEEIAPVTDRAWRMGQGGVLRPEPTLALGAARAFGDAASEFSGFA
jgi:energy-coupling factor transport system ATP-binding protein